MKSLIGFVVLAAFAGLSVVDAQNKVVCYLGSWAGYRQGNGQFNIDNIDVKLCTHVIYSFVGITTDGGIRSLDTYNDLPSGKDGFGKFNRLRLQNPSLKTLVAIGGWNEGSSSYSLVMANPVLRANFINNAVTFTKQYGFDGFDLDWEYPAQRGGGYNDKANFVSLLKEMRARFDQEGLLLTAAVGCTEGIASISYDVPALSKYLDFINVMAYDIHGSYEAFTGQNAPLYASSLDKSVHQQQLNVKSSIEYWIANGAAPSKLILGIGTYGRHFTLTSSSTQLGAPANGPGPMGPYTLESGFWGYNEICEAFMAGGWTQYYDEEQQVPYAVKGNVWLGYDDVRSVRAKVEFALSLGLGGAMIWSIETDDFTGKCGQKYPILSTINEVLASGSAVASTAGPTAGPTAAPTSAPTSAATAAPTTAAPTTAAPTTAAPTTSAPVTTTQAPASTTSQLPASGVCESGGYVRDPVDCSVFYLCQEGAKGYITHKYTCPAGLVFDPVSNVCNYDYAVQC